MRMEAPGSTSALSSLIAWGEGAGLDTLETPQKVWCTPGEERHLHWTRGRKRAAFEGGGGLHANELLAAPAPRGEVNIDTWFLK